MKKLKDKICQNNRKLASVHEQYQNDIVQCVKYSKDWYCDGYIGGAV